MVPVAETIRKKADIIFVLLCSDYNDTPGNTDTIVNIINSDLPEDFEADLGSINVLFINHKIIVLGGLGLKSEVTKEILKEVLNKMVQVRELQWVLQDNPILMIYAHDQMKAHIESIRDSIYELNGIHKMNVMVRQQRDETSHVTVDAVTDLFRHVFIAQ
jgi:hypothetical protein